VLRLANRGSTIAKGSNVLPNSSGKYLQKSANKQLPRAQEEGYRWSETCVEKKRLEAKMK